MQISDFNYVLPDELIALQPPKTRGNTRLLVLDRRSGAIEHRKYADFVEYLEPGDVVVLNDTKVIKARLLAKNKDDKPRELLLLEDHHNTNFSKRRCLYKGSLHAGEILTIGGAKIVVTNIEGGGVAEISANFNLLDLAGRKGQVPLPPYMHRQATADDTKRYQTVFAKHAGSVAAPTASLNMTQGLLDAIVAKGATVSYLSLHVGLGTFLPIRTDKIEDHIMHSEYFEIPTQTAQIIRAASLDGRRIWAVGTTVARTLEYAQAKIMSPHNHGIISGEADIFIYPGYKFGLVGGLLTNFHAPKSTVLMMAAAFAGWENLQHAYKQAIEQKYAFLSYGDSMLIL